MTTLLDPWTVNRIKQAAMMRGSHWFSPDTMRFFGTRVLNEVYEGPGGIYFVTSEQPPHGRRACTVRKFRPDNADISTVGSVAELSPRAAKAEARRMAAGCEQEPITTTAEKFRVVTVLEQFTHDLAAHGSGIVDAKAPAALMRMAREHHHLMELLCSDEAFCRGIDAEGDHPRITICRERIGKAAAKCGAARVVFGGDPRGPTVKVTFADGATDDMAREGWIVPTE